MALECPMLGAPGLPQAMPLSTFGVAADALLYVSADETQLGDIELGTDETAEKADLGTPFETDLIGWAHTNCLQSGNAADLGRLLRRAPDDAAARADAQHCGSALAIQVNDATGGSIGSATLGPGPTPAGNAPGTGMRLVKNGSVALTGPIAALHCVTSDESAETIENDTLLVTVVSAAGETSLHTETPDLDGTMLSAPLTFSTEALQQAAGVSDGGSIELHASRRSPGCGGLYGADGDVTRLFTLTFSTPSPACPTCGSGSFCYKGSCCTPARCGDGVETGPSCGVGDDGCGGTLDCGACPPPGPCKPFFTKDQCITKNQQGDVTYQRCGLWADGCASAGVPENVDCGACPSGQWCESGHCTVCPDCSIYSIISLGCGLNQTVCGPIMCSAC
jgi:hypothetical protein